MYFGSCPRKFRKTKPVLFHRICTRLQCTVTTKTLINSVFTFNQYLCPTVIVQWLYNGVRKFVHNPSCYFKIYKYCKTYLLLIKYEGVHCLTTAVKRYKEPLLVHVCKVSKIIGFQWYLWNFGLKPENHSPKDLLQLIKGPRILTLSLLDAEVPMIQNYRNGIYCCLIVHS